MPNKNGTFILFSRNSFIPRILPRKMSAEPPLVQLQSDLELAVRKGLPCCTKVLEKLGNQNRMPIVGTHRFPSFLV